MLKNFQNYGLYIPLIQNGWIVIDSKNINKGTWQMHYTSILNILKDGIELEEVQNLMIKVVFHDYKAELDLNISDYLINLIMWRGIIEIGDIKPCHVFFEDALTRREIKKYVDTYIIDVCRKTMSNRKLNNLISDMLDGFKFINEFALYLGNTIDLESDIKLMREDPDVFDIFHRDMTGVPIEDVKAVGMEDTLRLINKIKNSDHCLSDVFKSKEGINDKQYKEYAVNIGTKPDGRGGVFPVVINTSFINGGLIDVASYFVETSAGRIAQIISKTNVGESGHFARLLGLNCSETILHSDPNYTCNSTNFEIVHITSLQMFNMFINRYYRMSPNGMEYLLKRTDTHLVGQTLYFRSPMTCASKSKGHGVCYRCYGDIAYTNCDVNIGKMAAEILSSVLTQILLSAKHLLESRIKKILWSKRFADFFQIDVNTIAIQDELQLNGLRLLIDPESIESQNDYDNIEFNEYLKSFDVTDKAGNIYPMHTTEADKLYITQEFNEIIRKHAAPVDGKVSIDFKDISDISLFVVKLSNNDLSATLDSLIDVINKNAETKKHNRHSILQEFLEIVIKGGLDITAVHCEVILSNQLRSAEDIMEEPDWSIKNVPYQVLTLNQALTHNPSIVVSMSYKSLSRTLYNPLSFSPGKQRPSFMDLFFMNAPQIYTKDEPMTIKGENIIKE